MFSMPTPTATMREDFERVERLKEKGATTIYSRANNPDGTGRHHGLLTYMGFYDLLPTVQTTDWNTPLTPTQKENYEKRYEGKGVVSSCTYQLRQMAADGLLPTPKDLLPTPVVMEDRRKIYGEKAEDEHRTEKMMSNLNPYSIEQGMGLENGAITAAKDGKTSRLSPLFTEEMMGFPLMWTALPFLSESGAPKPSKPTATPSSPK